MTLTVKEIIKQNDEKRKILTPENEGYYENLLIFIRANAFRNERATEEVLLEMLDHLIEGQKDGKSAEDIFGKNPQRLAEEIIQSLPKESIKDIVDFGIEIAFTLFGWYLVVWGSLPLIQQQNQTVHLGSLAVSAILLVGSLVILLYTVFAVVRKSTFSDQKKKRRTIWLFSILGAVLLVAAFLLNFIVTPFGPVIEVAYYTGFGLGCFLLLATYILKKSREAK